MDDFLYTAVADNSDVLGVSCIRFSSYISRQLWRNLLANEQ